MKLNPLLKTLAFTFVFVAGAVFAAETKKEAAPASKVAACCDTAAKDGKVCAHGCCVEAAKAGNNCTRCGGAGAIATAEKKK
jgi:hypothetical protein